MSSINFIIFDDSGNITKFGHCPEDQLSGQLGPGEKFVIGELPEPAYPGKYIVARENGKNVVRLKE